MPRTRLQTPFATELDLPPPFHAIGLREVGDAFAHAVRVAEQEGAGALVYVGRFDLAEFAVVLEPDEPLRTARRAFYAGMAALAETLAAHAPPEKPLAIDWPDAIRVDGGLVGGGRLGWPQGADEEAPPPWLVFGAAIRTVSLTGDTGLTPLAAALEDEGFGDIGAQRIVEDFARYLMVAIDAWQNVGFAAVARQYVMRLPGKPGLRRDIADNGDLVLRRTARSPAERHALLPALATPSWLDPATGGPKL